MSHQTQAGHSHVHGPHCGHVAIKHAEHVDYLHDGHLHHPQNGQIEECVIEVSHRYPDACKPVSCAPNHDHGPGCGHEAIPHGNHVDYLVGDHLHHAHGNHCDDHGAILMA